MGSYLPEMVSDMMEPVRGFANIKLPSPGLPCVNNLLSSGMRFQTLSKTDRGIVILLSEILRCIRNGFSHLFFSLGRSLC